MSFRLVKRKPWVVVSGLSAAAVVNAGVLGALWGLFDSASRMPWLKHSESHEALLHERCGRVAGTGPRRQCVEGVVAAVQRRGSGIELARAGGRTAPIGASAPVER